MITIQRSAERHHRRGGQRDVWFTFHPGKGREPSAGGFEALIGLDEGLLSPGASVPFLPLAHTEVITYVLEGALAIGRSAGGAGSIYAGEFQRRSTVPGDRHEETNPSRSAWTRVFQISLLSVPGALQRGRETKRFSMAQRRGVLCVVASPEGRNGSLCVQSDALVYSALLESGRHMALALAPGSRAWLHIVAGEVRVGGALLAAGDGAGLAAEYAVSLIALGDTEILLVVQAEARPGSAGPGYAR